MTLVEVIIPAVFGFLGVVLTALIGYFKYSCCCKRRNGEDGSTPEGNTTTTKNQLSHQDLENRVVLCCSNCQWIWGRPRPVVGRVETIPQLPSIGPAMQSTQVNIVAETPPQLPSDEVTTTPPPTSQLPLLVRTAMESPPMNLVEPSHLTKTTESSSSIETTLSSVVADPKRKITDISSLTETSQLQKIIGRIGPCGYPHKRDSFDHCGYDLSARYIARKSIGAEGPAIGIDLGTTYSCAAVWRDGQVVIIPNEQGNRTTPSYVAFVDKSRLVGDAALNQATLNPSQTIFDAKRLIGRTFREEIVQNDMKLWPFKVVEGSDHKPMVTVYHQGRDKEFSAEEISSLVLMKLKEEARTFLGTTVKNAVITVPAYFNDTQRQATRNAGVIAGFNVMHIINEPIAAAVAYGLDRSRNGEFEKKNALIFDLGGGTFDVSILEIADGILEVKATNGDTHLGGGDFDNRMVKYLTDEFKRKYKKDISGEPKALRRLRTACEKAKRNLSGAAEATIEIDALYEGIDFYAVICRAKFEELNLDLFNKCMDPVIQCLKDAGMEKQSIHDLVLVGGSTRIPKVQKLVQDFFNGKALSMKMDPDEAVARGAAIQAAMLGGDPKQRVDINIVLHDVTPLSLGVKVDGGMMSIIIPRNTPMPVKKVEEYTTFYDDQTSVDIKIYEGERAMIWDNNFLGEFRLTGIPPAPASILTLAVTFEIDSDGILHATALDKGTGRKSEITVVNERGRLSKSEIDRIINKAKSFREEDKAMKKKVEARNDFVNYTCNVKKNIVRNKVTSELSSIEKRRVEEAVEEAVEWLDYHPVAELAELASQKEKLDDVWYPLVQKIYKRR